MRDAARLILIVATIGLLFFVHDHPETAKNQAAETAQTITSDVNTAIKENATEDRVQGFVESVALKGQALNESAQRIVESVLKKMGYGE